jgi:hypothetical protein
MRIAICNEMQEIMILLYGGVWNVICTCLSFRLLDVANRNKCNMELIIAMNAT